MPRSTMLCLRELRERTTAILYQNEATIAVTGTKIQMTAGWNRYWNESEDSADMQLLLCSLYTGVAVRLRNFRKFYRPGKQAASGPERLSGPGHHFSSPKRRKP